MDEKPPIHAREDLLPENPSRDEVYAELQRLEAQLYKITDRMRELLAVISQMDAASESPE